MFRKTQSTNVAVPPSPETVRAYAKRAIAIGALLVALGLAVSMGSYIIASERPQGGSYVVLWGPMLFGIITLVRGLVALRRANAQVREAMEPRNERQFADGQP